MAGDPFAPAFFAGDSFAATFFEGALFAAGFFEGGLFAAGFFAGALFAGGFVGGAGFFAGAFARVAFSGVPMFTSAAGTSLATFFDAFALLSGTLAPFMVALALGSGEALELAFVGTAFAALGAGLGFACAFFGAFLLAMLNPPTRGKRAAPGG